MKSFPQDEDLIDLGKDMRSSYMRNKAYFLYKDSQISLSNDSFKIDCELNPNYHIYYDWVIMCEDVVLTIKGEQCEKIWFENTIINYFMVMIYKLDKAKFIIPRILYLIKFFDIDDLDYYNKLSNLAPWIWLFWLLILFENLNKLLKNKKK